MSSYQFLDLIIQQRDQIELLRKQNELIMEQNRILWSGGISAKQVPMQFSRVQQQPNQFLNQQPIRQPIQQPVQQLIPRPLFSRPITKPVPQQARMPVPQRVQKPLVQNFYFAEPSPIDIKFPKLLEIAEKPVGTKIKMVKQPLFTMHHNTPKEYGFNCATEGDKLIFSCHAEQNMYNCYYTITRASDKKIVASFPLQKNKGDNGFVVQDGQLHIGITIPPLIREIKSDDVYYIRIFWINIFGLVFYLETVRTLILETKARDDEMIDHMINLVCKVFKKQKHISQKQLKRILMIIKPGPDFLFAKKAFNAHPFGEMINGKQLPNMFSWYLKFCKICEQNMVLLENNIMFGHITRKKAEKLLNKQENYALFRIGSTETLAMSVYMDGKYLHIMDGKDDLIQPVRILGKKISMIICSDETMLPAQNFVGLFRAKGKLSDSLNELWYSVQEK